MRHSDEYQKERDRLKRLIRDEQIKFEEREDILAFRTALAKLERDNCEDCPKCETGKLIAQWGGGVECDNEGCHYWFCY